jgi:hypothetical protein
MIVPPSLPSSVALYGAYELSYNYRQSGHACRKIGRRGRLLRRPDRRHLSMRCPYARTTPQPCHAVTEDGDAMLGRVDYAIALPHHRAREPVQPATHVPALLDKAFTGDGCIAGLQATGLPVGTRIDLIEVVIDRGAAGQQPSNQPVYVDDGCIPLGLSGQHMPVPAALRCRGEPGCGSLYLRAGTATGLRGAG